MTDMPLALSTQTRDDLMPALTITESVDRFNALVEFVKTVMHEGNDYGVIPGTAKPTLLKPGAEKLCTLFGLTKRFELVDKVEDWSGDEHNTEPFFYYRFRSLLLRGERLIADSEGSCNSWEKKYRYRNQNRTCPQCGKETIIKGKAEYGGGWLCFGKKGGCGAKFTDGDPAIETQPIGQIKNPDIADLVNTIQKMAQKRAFVAATLVAVNASEFFTQDVEDLSIEPIIESPVVMRRAEQSGNSDSAPADKPAPRNGNGKTTNGGNGNGGSKQPSITTPNWFTAAAEFAEAYPRYQDKDGKPNMFHLLGAVAKCGYREITNSNLQEIVSVLRDREDVPDTDQGQGMAQPTENAIPL